MTELKVFIYPNFEKTHSFGCTAEAYDILSSLGCEIIMPDFCRETFCRPAIEYCDPEAGVGNCDVMISVGGDGTILKCAKLASKNGKRLLGINCGRLGFMATLEREELPYLKALIDGDFKVEERMMLEIGVDFSGGSSQKIYALNEAVISGGAGRGIQDFTVLADGMTVSSLRADGLIFSTPTGASAYSLSAGGPLIEPTLDCIEFTQICPHSLFARTMLFAPDKVIEVRFHSGGKCLAALSADGQEPVMISESDKVYIRRAEKGLKLIDIRGGSYFRAINRKLMQPVKPTEM